MISYLTREQMSMCDRAAAENLPPFSVPLMERAASAAADYLLNHADLFPCKDVLVVCMGGNNGGDGIAMALILRRHGVPVRIAYAGPSCNGLPDPSSMTEETKRYLALAKEAGIPLGTELSLAGATCVVDALFGIGLDRALPERVETWIRAVNASGIPVLSMDIPSGLCADTGVVLTEAVRATATCTFGQLKPGLYLYPGAGYCGAVEHFEIGIGPEPVADDVKIVSLEDKDAKALLPARPVRSNRGTFGKLDLFCGSVNMCGAAVLAARAAFRSGVGLVRVVTPEENRVIIQTSVPEAVLSTYTEKADLHLLPEDGRTAVAGCGLGQSDLSLAVLSAVLQSAKGPLVLDADALNLLAAHESLWDCVPANSIITPHPGEAARLLHCDAKKICDSVLDSARTLAERHGVVCLLKDAHTVIASPDGRVCINRTGCTGLATAGSGDVLAGLVGSLLAQGLRPFDAAALGAFIHGKAGEAASSRFGVAGMAASDLPCKIARVISELSFF